ncbi:MAG: 6-phospho-3-hexuloisomerase [Planctomycetota bacterium]
MPNDSKRLIHILDEVKSVLSSLKLDELELLSGRILSAKWVFIASAGRSGLVMRMFAIRLTQAGIPTHVAGDPTTPACAQGDLFLIGSGSGNTLSIRVLAEQAKKAGCEVVLITRDPSSAIAIPFDTKLYIPVPLDASQPGGLSSTQPLGTLFEQSLMFVTDLLFEKIMEKKGLLSKDLHIRHANLE